MINLTKRSPFPAGLSIRKVILMAALVLGSSFSVSSAERAYPLGCSKEPNSYYDYIKSPFPPPDLAMKTVDDYMIVQRLGTGKFSDVFEAVDVEVEKKLLQQMSLSSDGAQSKSIITSIDPRTVVVLKCLKPVSERKVRREILILQHASKLPNMARIKALVLPSTNEKGETIGVPTLVLEHAGPDCRWLSHYGGGSTTLGATKDDKLLDNNHQNNNKPSSTTTNDEDDDDDEDTLLSDYEIRYYLFHLLVALDCLHQKGIMHRDVKPRNCLIRRLGHGGDHQHQYHHHHHDSLSKLQSSTTASLDEKRSLYHIIKSHRCSPLMLIDLGLADFYLPKQKYNVRVASRHYKSPELLVGFEYYDYALDLWGVGCILASLLCFREPFFRGKDNLDQLGKIIMQLGTTDLLAYIVKYNIPLEPDVKKLIQSYHATGQFLHRKSWKEFVAQDNNNNNSSQPPRPRPDEKGLDLLDKLLVYDHKERWNARQAMEHPFFDVVRRRVLTEVMSYTEPGVVKLPSLSHVSSSLASPKTR